MWIRVNRRTLPLYTYSEQISVVIGKHIVYIMQRKYVATQSIDYTYDTMHVGGATMEMSIRLWPSEPCYEFSVSW